MSGLTKRFANGVTVAVKYQPAKILKKMKLEDKAGKLVTKNLTLNRVAVRSLANAGVLSEKQIQKLALKVIKEYKATYADEIAAGNSQTQSVEEALNDKKLMIARVQSAVLNEQTNLIKTAYRGEFYKWLPSTAANPDEKHMKKYGKIFRLGKGEAPGDRYGCQCGMEIQTDETPKDFQERLDNA